jgi:hypothetical protein
LGGNAIWVTKTLSAKGSSRKDRDSENKECEEVFHSMSPCSFEVFDVAVKLLASYHSDILVAVHPA